MAFTCITVLHMLLPSLLFCSLSRATHPHLSGGQSEDAREEGKGCFITLTEVGRPAGGEDINRPFLYRGMKRIVNYPMTD